MTPWELVKKSEHSHQRAVFAWANCAALYGFDAANDPLYYNVKTRPNGGRSEPVPDLRRLFAVHNQGHGDVIRGAQARAEGVKPGVPDMMWPRPVRGWNGLFIELKRARANATAAGTETSLQADWREYLTGQRYKCVVAVGWLEATAAIQTYWG